MNQLVQAAQKSSPRLVVDIFIICEILLVYLGFHSSISLFLMFAIGILAFYLGLPRVLSSDEVCIKFILHYGMIACFINMLLSFPFITSLPLSVNFLYSVMFALSFFSLPTFLSLFYRNRNSTGSLFQVILTIFLIGTTAIRIPPLWILLFFPFMRILKNKKYISKTMLSHSFVIFLCSGYYLITRKGCINPEVALFIKLLGLHIMSGLLALTSALLCRFSFIVFAQYVSPKLQKIIILSSLLLLAYMLVISITSYHVYQYLSLLYIGFTQRYFDSAAQTLAVYLQKLPVDIQTELTSEQLTTLAELLRSSVTKQPLPYLSIMEASDCIIYTPHRTDAARTHLIGHPASIAALLQTAENALMTGKIDSEMTCYTWKNQHCLLLVRIKNLMIENQRLIFITSIQIDEQYLNWLGGLLAFELVIVPPDQYEKAITPTTNKDFFENSIISFDPSQNGSFYFVFGTCVLSNNFDGAQQDIARIIVYIDPFVLLKIPDFTTSTDRIRWQSTVASKDKPIKAKINEIIHPMENTYFHTYFLYVILFHIIFVLLIIPIIAWYGVKNLRTKE